MVSFDKEKVKSILIQEYHLEKPKADIVVKSLENLDDQLQETLDLWIESRKISDFQVEGVDLQLIMKKWQCNFHNALLIMDTYIHNPDLAKQFLKIETPFFTDTID